MMSSTHSSKGKAPSKSTTFDEKPTRIPSVYRQSILQMSSGEAAFELSPQKFKEYLIEFIEMNSTIGFVNDMNYLHTMLDLSSMDEANPGDFQPLSLSSVLHTRVQQEARMIMLHKTITLLLTDKPGQGMRDAVESLLDDDLKTRELNFDPETCKGRRPIVLKAQMIVGDTARSTMTREPLRGATNEFEIELCMLINGQGDSFRRMKLFFPYRDPFENFLNTLRDATLLCAKQPIVSDTSSRGYTLKDGPWTYQLVNTKNHSKLGTAKQSISQEGKPMWYNVKDESTYRDMLVNIKNFGGGAVFWHSLDKSIQQRYEETKEEERKELNGMYEVLDENGKPFFEKGTYMEYLEEMLARGEDC